MTVGTPILTSLPPEILLLIAEHLDAYELVRFSRTCRVLSYFGGCKSVAKAFMRSGTAVDAIYNLEHSVTRLDLIAELFRYVKNQGRVYSNVASIAARLNDLKQLQAWRDEFGFFPSDALIGAAYSDRIETFEFIFPHVKIDVYMASNVFIIVGTSGNRALLDHLRSKHPEMVTLERLETVVMHSALAGQLDLALEVLEGISSRSGQVIVECAGHITSGAAYHGDTALFAEFINKFQYDDERRDDIAAAAAAHGRMDFIRLQEGGRNAAVSFGDALESAIQNDVLEVVQYLLGSDEFVEYRFERLSLVDALRLAIELRRTEMLPLLLARVPQMSLLHDAAKSESLDEAKLLLGGFGISDKVRSEDDDWEVEFDAYSDDVPDWQMTIWLIIIGLESNARLLKSDIDDAERARYQGALPAAIDLVRELELDDDDTINEMIQFTNGTIE